jgi:hypothetical protein
VKNWSEFRAGTEEGILPLSDIMAIMGTPRHSAKLNGKYMSTASEYAPIFFQKLKEITRNSPFWNPNPVSSEG